MSSRYFRHCIIVYLLHGGLVVESSRQSRGGVRQNFCHVSVQWLSIRMQKVVIAFTAQQSQFMRITDSE